MSQQPAIVHQILDTDRAAHASQAIVFIQPQEKTTIAALNTMLHNHGYLAAHLQADTTPFAKASEFLMGILHRDLGSESEKMSHEDAKDLAHRFAAEFDANTAVCYMHGKVTHAAYEKGLIIADGKHAGVCWFSEDAD